MSYHSNSRRQYQPFRRSQKFRISGWVEIAVHSEVEASSPEAALRKAKRLQKEGNLNWEEGNWGSGVHQVQVFDEKGKPLTFVEKKDW